MTRPSRPPRDPGRRAIAGFFDHMARTREAVFQTTPVIDYEQHERGRAVVAHLDPRPGQTILDVGCGNARDIPPLLQAGATVVGVDLSEGMIEQARVELAAAGYPTVRLEVGDATSLPFADGTFDKVVCSEVIEHIPDIDVAIAECHRVLKPGGVLVVSTPNRWSWYGFDRFVLWTAVLRRPWNHPFDNWRTRAEVHSLLERHGFAVITSATVGYAPGFLLTYRLPRSLQSFLVGAIRRTEPLLHVIAAGVGYTLVVSATRRT